jgi:NAD-dependent deacetylase
MAAMDRALATLAERLRLARRVTVLTGAGVSAASGVPTFRSGDGLWKHQRPEDLATPEAFARDPEGVWAWYAWRRARVAACAPNAAHRVLARWSQELPSCTVITQNVDDLHVRAGTRGLIRLHGTLWALACSAGCRDGVTGWEDRDVAEPIRRCSHCGAWARPGVVWFGEGLDPDVLEAATSATRCDVFLTIGTSALVYPAAGLVALAQDHGAYTVEINPEATPASAGVDVAIANAAEVVLPEVDALMTSG